MLICCFLLLGCGAEQENQLTIVNVKTSELPEEIAQITFEKTEHDFGDVHPSSIHSCEFEFTNTGNGLLEIKNVARGCNCQVVSLDKKEYLPGESGTIQVKYKAEKKPDSVSRNVFVHTNDPENAKIILTVKANVMWMVSFKPERLNLSLDKPNAGCEKIVLTSADGQSFGVTNFASSNSVINADFDKSANGLSVTFEPVVNMRKLGKYLNGQVKIDLTHPQCKQLVIPFFSRGRFRTEPGSITLMDVRPGIRIRRHFFLRSNYDEDFEIESISCKKGSIKVVKQKKLSDHYKVDLIIIPPETDENTAYFSDVLVIKIKDNPDLEMNCRVYYSKKRR
jgi:hypothetical protein